MAGNTTVRKPRTYVEGARHGTLTGYTEDLCGCEKCLPSRPRSRRCTASA
ncbi:hypothetical protein ACFQX6_11240 [Streptosporangium lutulentum]